MRSFEQEHATVEVSEQPEHDVDRTLPERPDAASDPSDTSPQYHDAAGPPPAQASPTPPRTREPHSHRPLSPAPPAPKPPGAFEKALTFVLALLLDAGSQTLEWLGLTRLRRLPVALACYATLFFFLGLPNGWAAAPFGGRVVELANWGPHTALLAFLVQLSGTFAMRLVLARPRIRMARITVPSQTRKRLIERADELLATPVQSKQDLQYWIDQHDAWLHQAILDLGESYSKSAADQLGSVTMHKAVRFRHAYNPVHDGWLNLLAHRIEYLRGLTDRDR